MSFVVNIFLNTSLTLIGIWAVMICCIPRFYNDDDSFRNVTVVSIILFTTFLVFVSCCLTLLSIFLNV